MRQILLSKSLGLSPGLDTGCHYWELYTSLVIPQEVNYKLDVHKSVHRDTTMKITNKMHFID